MGTPQEAERSTDKRMAELGSTIAKVGKAAAASGMPGAALTLLKGPSKRWILAIGTVLLIPILLLAMVPTIIFGPLMSNDSEKVSGFVSNQSLTDNLTALNLAISGVLSEGLEDVLERIERNFNTSGCDAMEVINPYGADVVYNANAILSIYCASKNENAADINENDMAAIMRQNKQHLYSFTYSDQVRTVRVPSAVHPESETRIEIVRVYTIHYNGESYFADNIFRLNQEQKELAELYTQNLTVLLSDGVYQGLEDAEVSGGFTAKDVTFTDGSTPVTYFNQLDERWKNKPYGTDNIGGYACGPTAMAIVVSSLTDTVVDPPTMAQWAYDHGYWCSGNGSYQSLIPGAAKAWGLHVEGCRPSEPQRIVDALSSGKLVVGIMGKGHFTKSGHFIVLRGVTSGGKILVADPASYKRSQNEWDLNIILNEASRRAGSGGPFWIIGA